MENELEIKDDLSRKVIRNATFNIIGRIWYFLVTIFLTPYIIGHIGIERYGIWVFTGVLAGYFGLLDLGIGFAFIKYISEFYAKKDFAKINQLVNTGFVFYALFSLLVVVLSFFVINPIISLLKIPPGLHSEASLVFFLGFVLFAIINFVVPFVAIPSGLQRMDITNKVDMIMSVPNIMGTIFFLERGYGLRGLMINSIAIFFLKSIVNIIINYRILPELKFNPFSFSKDMFKKFFSYGYKLQVAYLSSMVSVHFDKLLISYFLSIGLVTFYQLGSTIVTAIRSITTLLIPPLIPAFSEINARQQKAKLIDGYIKGTKYFALIAAPIFTFMIISAYQIMIIWMGKGFDKAAWIIQILGLGWLITVLAAVASAVAQAIARTDIEMKSALIGVICNVVLSIALIRHFGFAGVAFGTAISLFLGVIYYFIKLHKEIELSLSWFLKTTILLPMVLSLCIGLPAWKFIMWSQNSILDFSRIHNLIIFIIQAIIFFGLYLVVLLLLKPLDDTDRRLLQDKIPIARYLIIKLSK
jgi:O-antigen/teichoic acid export membrane protein